MNSNITIVYYFGNILEPRSGLCANNQDPALSSGHSLCLDRFCAIFGRCSLAAHVKNSVIPTGNVINTLGKRSYILDTNMKRCHLDHREHQTN